MKDKILLCAVNSKFIHTSLAVRSLYHYVNDERVSFCEFTINESAYSIMSEIYSLKCSAVLFSCYIWNIEIVSEIAQMLKSVSPHTQIILGGPEVSHNSVEVLEKYPFADAVFCGEGEETFKEYLDKGIDIKGVTLRKNGKIVQNEKRELIADISKLPFPYSDEDLEQNKNKLIYYESSRGCPFNCSYCLSSTVHSLRFKDVETVKNDFLRFIKHGVKIVKLVDRTFNADKKRTKELMRFLIENAGNITFHFEAAADLIDEEMLTIIQSAPKGLFQLEIGVQTTNPKTIEAIDRKTDLKKLSYAVRKIKSFGNTHIHLDLIAGLPYEDIESFKKSFDDVFALKGDMLQLGFLKLLYGTKIRMQGDEFECKFTQKPPYEILQNKFMSFEDIQLLKGIENVLEKFYNSHAFENSMEYLLKKEHSAFEFFGGLYEFYKEKGYENTGVAKETLYKILAEFKSDDKLFLDILKLDYFINNKPKEINWTHYEYDKSILKKRFKILSEEFIKENLTEYEGIDLREVIKSVHFENFKYDVTNDNAKMDNIIAFDKKYNRVIRVK